MKKYDDDMLRQLIDGDPRWGVVAKQPRPQRKRFATALQREQESVQEAGMLGYQARIVVQCSLPYRRQLVTHWQRTNGAVTLSILADPTYGLPYGVYPRLLLTWVTTEAVRKQSRQIDLSDSLNAFMAKLGIAGNANGEKRKRFKDQTLRLFTATFASTLQEVSTHNTHDDPQPVHIGAPPTKRGFTPVKIPLFG